MEALAIGSSASFHGRCVTPHSGQCDPENTLQVLTGVEGGCRDCVQRGAGVSAVRLA